MAPRRAERLIARPISKPPAASKSSNKRGAPVEASELEPDAAVARVGALTGPESEASAAGAGAPPDPADEEGVSAGTVAVDGDVVGCGHEASALPSRDACTPHSVTGTVAPVPGLAGLRVDVEGEPLPVQVPSAVPSSAAEMAQTETGAKTGADPSPVVVET